MDSTTSANNITSIGATFEDLIRIGVPIWKLEIKARIELVIMVICMILLRINQIGDTIKARKTNFRRKIISHVIKAVLILTSIVTFIIVYSYNLDNVKNDDKNNFQTIKIIKTTVPQSFICLIFIEFVMFFIEPIALLINKLISKRKMIHKRIEVNGYIVMYKFIVFVLLVMVQSYITHGVNLKTLEFASLKTIMILSMLVSIFSLVASTLSVIYLEFVELEQNDLSNQRLSTSFESLIPRNANTV